MSRARLTPYLQINRVGVRSRPAERYEQLGMKKLHKSISILILILFTMTSNTQNKPYYNIEVIFEVENRTIPVSIFKTAEDLSRYLGPQTLYKKTKHRKDIRLRYSP